MKATKPTRGYVIRVAILMIVVSLAIGTAGCSNDPHPTESHVSGGGKGDRSLLNEGDTAVMNNAGTWHNDAVAIVRPSLDALSPGFKATIYDTESLSFQYTENPVATHLNSIPDLASVTIPFATRQAMHLDCYFAPRDYTDVQWRTHFDALRIANGLGAFYLTVWDSLMHICNTSNSPADFDLYMWRTLTDPALTAAERQFVRIGASIGKGSSTYWIANPARAIEAGAPRQLAKSTALPLLAKVDLAGGLIGAAWGIWDGENWRGVLKRAVQFGAGASLLRYIK